MNRTSRLGLAGVVLAALGSGCTSFDAGEPGQWNSALVEPPTNCNDLNAPLLCGWENGAKDWFNLFQQLPQSTWLNQPDSAPVTQLWEHGWRNDWELWGTNSYALGWTNAWKSAWHDWNFSIARFAWAFNPQLPSQSHCEHPASEPGGPLTKTCSSVVSAVCDQMPGCCGMLSNLPTQGALGLISVPRFGSWDSTCVQKAVTLAEGWSGKHSVLEVGVALPDHDIHESIVLHGKVGSSLIGGHGGLNDIVWRANPCAIKVCATSGYDSCCHGTALDSWSTTCVKKAVDLCTVRYTANTRVDPALPTPPPPADPGSGAGTPPASPVCGDDGICRVFTDVCYEATELGFARCPVQRTSVGDSQECCRRALVLRGVYRAVDSTKVYPEADLDHFGKGRLIDWIMSDTVLPTTYRLGNQPRYPVEATLALDNCYVDLNGVRVCEDRKHKLWQTAGPGGPLYPDYPELPVPDYPSGCPTSKPVFTPKAERCTDFSHGFLGYRRLLMAVLSGLITTDSSHVVDFQWRPDNYYDSNGQPVEVSEHSPDPFLDQRPANFRLSFANFDTWEGNWGTDEIDEGHLVTSASCYGPNAPQRAHGKLVQNVLPCDPAHPAGHIQTFFNIPPVFSAGP